jgi:hypothetical protein
MKIFQKEFVEYLKPTWPYVLAVALIGQIQLASVFLVPPNIAEFFGSIQFLRISQVLWLTIIAISIFIMVLKHHFNFKQILFLGFLYILAFSFLTVFVRAIFLGHDIRYLLLGDAHRMSSFLLSILYISIVTIVTWLVALLSERQKLKSSVRV